LNHHEVNRRIAKPGAAAAPIAAAVALMLLGAPEVSAQGIMRTPNLNVGSRTPNITARINPNVAGRAAANTATIAGRGAAANLSTTAVRTTTVTSTSVTARVTPNVTAIVTPRVTPTITPRVTPMRTPRVAVVVPTLPYVRYSPNLYPACAYAYRGASGNCSGQPISSVDFRGIGSSGGPGGPPPRSQNAGAPRRNTPQAAANLRYLGDQIIAEIDSSQADELARRHRLTRIASQDFPLIGSAMSLFRITGRRSAENVRTELAAAGVRAVHLNFRYVLQDRKSAPAEGDPAQYALAKLRLPEAHALSRGANVTVAVIDSGIDVAHPELAGAIAESFDALGAKEGPHVHGTGIAGAIVSNARLMGSAPKARLLAIRAFGAAPSGAESTSFVILKSLDFAASHGAQIVNMSFAGPKDPLLERGIAAAATKGMVLVAAGGNVGPKSPPLYPAANSNVIAVSATDAHDRLFPASNRGSHIAVAAPGVDIFLPAPDGKYQMTSGTSFSAAYISGLAALMMARKPGLAPAEVRAILIKTARDLGRPGRDDSFGAGEADALGAVTAVLDAAVPVAAPEQPPDVKVAEPQALPVTRDSGPGTAAIASEKPAEN
jgi:subtilisin family serine protease